MLPRLTEVFKIGEAPDKYTSPKILDLMKRYAEKFGHEYDEDDPEGPVVGATESGAALYYEGGELYLYHWNPKTKQRDPSQSNNPITPQELERVIASGQDPARE